jgi:cephalosporin hydroxylase
LENYPLYDSLFGVTRLQTRLWDGLALPVNHNRDILDHNLRVLGIPKDCVDILQGFSSQLEIIGKVTKRQHNLLIIDGDHTYSGEKLDFENYLSAVKVGGYIVFDDYGIDDWPDIQRYVDDEVMPVDQLALVGYGWRTAVFRKTRP